MSDTADVPAAEPRPAKPKREKPFSLRMYPWVRDLAECLGQAEAELAQQGKSLSPPTDDPLFSQGFDGGCGERFSSLNDAINSLAEIGAWQVREWLSADLEHTLDVAKEYRELLKFALNNPDATEVQTGWIGSGLIARTDEKAAFKAKTWPVDRPLWMRLAAAYESKGDTLRKAIARLDFILEPDEHDPRPAKH